MNSFLSLAVVLLGAPLLIVSCSTSPQGLNMPDAPVADRRPHSETHHGQELVDPYFWLKDQSYPTIDDEDILDHLKEENAYYEHFATALNERVDKIYEELEGRIDKEDYSVPRRDGNYVYQSRFSKESQYRHHIRWQVPQDADLEQIFDLPETGIQTLLDENELAGNSEYFRLGTFSVSPDDKLLAYSSDTTGNEYYTLRIKHIKTKELLPEIIENVGGSVVWAQDSQSFLYVTLDEEWRPNKIWHHKLGSNPKDDVLVYEEADSGFFVGLSRTTSRKYALISTGSHRTAEVYVLSLSDLSGPPQLVAKRKDEHDYSLDHSDDFYILTNDTHKNYRLARTSIDALAPENWETVIAGTDERYITNFQAFESRLVVSYRESGLSQIAILDKENNLNPLQFEEETYTAFFHGSSESDPEQLRIGYSSLVTPSQTFDYDFATGNRYVRKVQKIPSGHDPDLYQSEWKMAPSHDGVLVPVSIVYRKDTPLDGSAPLYLRSYGAYGSSSFPSFSTSALSLLDRGFVYAIAHIRGGSELGFYWYEDGKEDKRKNTFRDFIAVAEYLIEQNYTTEKRIAISGGSAGGTLMGVVANDAPELWGAVVSHVPFVDVLNTMLDASLPLTPIEWPEWGNPITDPIAYEYIKSYSPYDQISAQDYPPMLVTAGLNDPRVTYWEPAKYVAKLRHLKTDNNLLLLRTEMGAGHGGKSGRFDSMRETAETFAFILHAMGIEDT